MEPNLVLGSVDADHLSIVLLGRAHPGATDYWDANWVRSTLNVRAGGFTAHVTAELRADEIHRFGEGLKFVDFTDRRIHDYPVDLRRCGAYMFATMIVCRLFGVSSELPTTDKAVADQSLSEVLGEPVEVDGLDSYSVFDEQLRQPRSAD